MRFCILIFLISSMGCKQPEIKKIAVPPTPSSIPKGALHADFFGNQDSLYAFVKEIDLPNQITYIGFEDDSLPLIAIPESMGAKLQTIKLSIFPQDLLLINATPIDTNFHEYHVYIWKDSLWKQPVNRFYIHNSNFNDSLVPIMEDPKDSTKLLRHYSVFDMDTHSDKKYLWQLRQESVRISE